MFCFNSGDNLEVSGCARSTDRPDIVCPAEKIVMDGPLHGTYSLKVIQYLFVVVYINTMKTTFELNLYFHHFYLPKAKLL